MRMFLVMMALALFIAQNIAWANSTDPATGITQANIHYQNKQYIDSIKIYEQLIAEGYKNGHLYYNLGNAHFRLGEIGPAIHSYLKAKILIPRDKDLDANLKSAILETIDQLEGIQTNNIFLLWLDDFNLQELIKALVIINLLFWTALTGWNYFRTGFWDLARKTLLSLLILATIASAAKYYSDTHNISGVVLAKSVDIKSTPESDNVTLFQLHEGAIISIIEKRGDWYKIELPEDKAGWLKTESIGT